MLSHQCELAFLGVPIEDLVTLLIREPYSMFKRRSEGRLVLG